MDPLEAISSSSVLSGSLAIFATSLFHIVVPLALATLAFARATYARSAARVGDEAGSASDPLATGPAVVRGPVEYAQGESAAVRVEITQHGVERVDKNNVLRHSWTEIDRTIRVRPFYVNDPRGRVRVEPDARAMLVDDLDETRTTGADTRVRVAELSPGEHVYVIGHLRSGATPRGGGAYRESAMAPVLEPPRRGRMLVSSKPLGDRFREAARRESRWGAVIVAIGVALLLLDLPFHLRLHAGVYERATVVDTRLISGKSSRCAVTLRTDDGVELTDSVRWGDCPPVAPGARLRIVRVPSVASFSQIGQAPGISTAVFILGLFAMIFLTAFYAMRSLPWWERRLVESGEGPLRR
jgi:hypothetical protein